MTRSQDTLEAIEMLFDANTKRYVINKNRGGESNLKGTCYEDVFAASKICKLARQFFETLENPFLEGQMCGFVDDLVISNDRLSSQSAFQLKNTTNVSWCGGKHPIKEDFFKQHRLSTHLGYKDIKLSLVTSDLECLKNLTPPPDSIANFSTVIHFPYDDAVHKLISEHEELHNDFGFLARQESCSVAESAQVAQVLIGAWIIKGRSGNLIDLIEKAREVSPTIVRPLRADAEALTQLRPETKLILDRIDGLNYSLVRGFLTWSAFGTKGILGYDCFSSRFSDFQKTIHKKAPQTFDEIEGWLI